MPNQSLSTLWNLSFVGRSSRFALPNRIVGCLVAIFVWGGAQAAFAELRTYRIEFAPSPSSEVAGYALHFGFRSGDYSGRYDIGEPLRTNAGFVYRAVIDHDADLFVALSAYDRTGRSSALSQEFSVSATGEPLSLTPPVSGAPTSPNPAPSPVPSPEPTPAPLPSPPDFGGMPVARPSEAPVLVDAGAELGLAIDRWGVVRSILGSKISRMLTFDSWVAAGDVRVSRCDLEGDGDEDVLLGFGRGSGGEILEIEMEAGFAVGQRSFFAGSDFYRRVDGQTWPACGDLDGDGRAEVVVGFGALGGTQIQVLKDFSGGFQPLFFWGRWEGMVPLSKAHLENQRDTSLHPAIGDIDGDGRGEIVVGYGDGGDSGITILDDALANYRIHPNVARGEPVVRLVGPHESSGARLATFPALGDWDGDGRDEIAIGFGVGGAGWVAFLEDGVGARYEAAVAPRMLQVGRLSHRFGVGSTRPTLADVDGNGSDELVIGFGGAAAWELQILRVPQSGSRWMVQDGSGFFDWGSAGTQTLIPSPSGG